MLVKRFEQLFRLTNSVNSNHQAQVSRKQNGQKSVDSIDTETAYNQHASERSQDTANDTDFPNTPARCLAR